MENLGVKRFWIDRPILVTGATGLVGSWLVRRLKTMDADVVCLVRDWIPQSELVRSNILDEVKIVRGDVRDQSLLERILGEYEVDSVVHLAAQTIVPIANRNAISTYETNIGGTWSLLEACRRSPQVKQIVIASSDKAYGDQENLPYVEEMPLRGLYPYDVSKSCADLIGQSYAYAYGLPVVISRCGNFFGGGDLNWNRIVPGTVRSILRRQRPIIRSDGNYLRDYFYVEDGANAYALLVEKLAEDRDLAGQAFNFSNEQPITVLEMADRITVLMASDLKPEVKNEATNEIRRQFLNAAKARRVLGWEPDYSLDEGLLKTIDWYRDYFQHPSGKTS